MTGISQGGIEQGCGNSGRDAKRGAGEEERGKGRSGEEGRKRNMGKACCREEGKPRDYGTRFGAKKFLRQKAEG